MALRTIPEIPLILGEIHPGLQVLKCETITDPSSYQRVARAMVSYRGKAYVVLFEAEALVTFTPEKFIQETVRWVLDRYYQDCPDYQI